MRILKWLTGLLLLAGILFLAGLEMIDRRWGEGISPDAMAKKHAAGEQALFAPMHSLQYGELKQAALARTQPDIAVIGSTRAFRFREEFFEPYSFYNAGGISRRLTEFESVFTGMPDSWKPELVIIPLESWNFKRGMSRPPEPSPELSFQDKLKYGYERRKVTWPYAWEQWKADPMAPFKSPRTEDGNWRAYGRFAIEKSFGVRPDGSLYQSHVHTADTDTHERRLGVITGNTEQNLESKGLLDGLDQTPDAQAWDRIEALAAEAERRGATLVMYAPPISPTYFPYMEDEEQYGLFYYLGSEALKSRMDELGIIYFDFSRFEQRDPPLGMIDLLHPSEGLEFDMWREMLKDERVRAAVPDMDMDNLRELANGAEPHRVIFERE